MQVRVQLSSLATFALGAACGIWCGSMLALMLMKSSDERVRLLWAPPDRMSFGAWRLLRQDATGDNLTGKAFSLAISETDRAEVFLQFFCDPIWSIEIRGAGLPSRQDGYDAIYRVVGETASTASHWGSGENVLRLRNSDPLTAQLRKEKMLSVEVTSSSAMTTRFSFDASGFNSAMDQFEQRCAVLPRPNPDPERA